MKYINAIFFVFLTSLAFFSTLIFAQKCQLYSCNKAIGASKNIGQSGNDLTTQLTNKQNEIRELEAKLGEIKSTKITLNNQLNYFNNQILLTTLKIDQTQKRVTNLQKEINKLGEFISQLDLDLNKLSTLLAERIVYTYKQRNINYLELLLTSRGFSDLFNKNKYIRTVQLHDKQVMFSMEQTRQTYDQQKTLKVQKQIELAQLEKQLDRQKSKLDTQKSTKEALLTVTKNDEKRYQKMLKAARAEQAALNKEISLRVKNLENGSPVQKGDIIALMGNTGYSTGAHLHFAITDKKGNNLNPTDYLSSPQFNNLNSNNKCSTGVCWDNYPDDSFSFTGNWDWPLSSGVRITQGYGYTWWANSGFYNGKPHTGIDMVGDNDITIRAPQSGILYTSLTDSAGANYVVIEHDNVMSWYWHVQ